VVTRQLRGEKTMTKWHQDELFWQLTEPFIFPPEQWKRAERATASLIDLISPQPDAAVLDLGCGPGRFSLPFARRGYQVTGVDLTSSYLQEARERAAAEGLAVQFLAGDMRTFGASAAFDLVLNITTFGYFEDHQENLLVLRNTYDVLKSGGATVIEARGKEHLVRTFQKRDWQERDGLYLLIERRVRQNWSWLATRWILIDGSDHEEFAMGHWLYSAVELEMMLHEAGFDKAAISIYGGYAGEPYTRPANRLIAVARK
jgi:SAM-dependent methyltransferase